MRNLLVLTLLLSSSFLFSQNKSRDEVLQLITEDVCECIQKKSKKFTKKTTSDRKKAVLGLCLIESYNVRKKLNKKMNNASVDYGQIGEEVGVLLVDVCLDDFMNLFSEEELIDVVEEEFLEEDNENTPPQPTLKKESDLIIKGELIAVKNDAVSYFIVKDSFNKEHIFIVKNQINGSEFLLADNIDKTITVYYTLEYFYDLSENGYTKKKVVTYIELDK
ncbi:hypothetical protein [Aurantibacter sp.]|uniref:hypothetical protein n=1 Tax=Aurantibacter sp. TaxID=2807103 RepID=UPI0035C79BEA